MSVRELRAGVSTRAIRTGVARTLPSQLYAVSVKGSRRAEVRSATIAIAERIVDEVGGYARLKRQTFQEQLASDNRQLAAIDLLIEETEAAMRGASGTERLTMATLLLSVEQRRGARIIDRGAAIQTTARSTRNSAAVAGLIGLLLGFLAALLWEPIAARAGRSR
jgi:hypothetical protein